MRPSNFYLPCYRQARRPLSLEVMLHEDRGRCTPCHTYNMALQSWVPESYPLKLLWTKAAPGESFLIVRQSASKRLLLWTQATLEAIPVIWQSPSETHFAPSKDYLDFCRVAGLRAVVLVPHGNVMQMFFREVEHLRMRLMLIVAMKMITLASGV